MRSIVAIGLATFATCMFTLTARATEATPCAEAGNTCCQQPAEASCPARPEAKTAAACPSTQATGCCGGKPCAAQGTCCNDATCTTKTACTKAGACTTATACSQEGTCAEGTCTKEATCAKTTTCTKETSAECTGSKCNQCEGKCAQHAPAEFGEIRANPIALASASSSAIVPLATKLPCTGNLQTYTIKCRIVEGHGTPTEKTLSAPVITVGEGITGSIGTHTSRPFVTGLRQDGDGRSEAIVTTLEEGTTVEVRVSPLADRQVQIDAKIEMASINESEETTSPFQTEEEREAQLQAPEVSTHARRVVRTVALGDTVEIACGCACCTASSEAVVMLTVDLVGEPTPGITPITKTAAVMEVEAGELYSEVYPVGDLMQPYAVHKEGSAVEVADFLPVIDMLLTESNCDWPVEAEIRPFPGNQSVVITQSRAGHAAIAKYLSAHRASVAEIEAHLLRK